MAPDRAVAECGVAAVGVSQKYTARRRAEDVVLAASAVAAVSDQNGVAQRAARSHEGRFSGTDSTPFARGCTIPISGEIGIHAVDLAGVKLPLREAGDVVLPGAGRAAVVLVSRVFSGENSTLHQIAVRPAAPRGGAGRRDVVLVGVGVKRDRRTALFETVDALGRPGFFPGLIQGGQQHGGQNCDDRYHDKEFDKSENPVSNRNFSVAGECFFLRIAHFSSPLSANSISFLNSFIFCSDSSLPSSCYC